MSGNQEIALPTADKLASYGVDEAGWQLLCNTLYPTATSAEQVLAVLEFCRARKYDPFRRPVHLIVRKATKRNPESFEIWPGINSIMSDAATSGKWAGIDKPEFGPMVELSFTDTWEDNYGNSKSRDFTVKFPEWCIITVYRRAPDGAREGYSIPVYWTEAYATVSQFSDVPNRMWQKRPVGMLQKCALAASLRAAFPEISDYAAEEMAGFEDGTASEMPEPVRSAAQAPAQTAPAGAASTGPAERFKAAAGNGAALGHDQFAGSVDVMARKVAEGAVIDREAQARGVPSNVLDQLRTGRVPQDVDPETGEVMNGRGNGHAPPPLPQPPDPLFVPVPRNERGGIAWAEWIEAFRAKGADLEPTDEHFKRLNAVNAHMLDELRKKKPEAPLRLFDEQGAWVADAKMRSDKPAPIPPDDEPPPGAHTAPGDLDDEIPF